MKTPLETHTIWSKQFGTIGLFGCAELECVALAICEQVKYAKDWASAVVDTLELRRVLNLQEGDRVDWLFNHCHLGPTSAHKCSVIGDLINEDGTLTERFLKKATNTKRACPNCGYPLEMSFNAEACGGCGAPCTSS